MVPRSAPAVTWLLVQRCANPRNERGRNNPERGHSPAHHETENEAIHRGQADSADAPRDQGSHDGGTDAAPDGARDRIGAERFGGMVGRHLTDKSVGDRGQCDTYTCTGKRDARHYHPKFAVADGGEDECRGESRSSDEHGSAWPYA